MEQETIQKLNRDITRASAQLSDTEARFLVDYYYIIQEDRKRSDNQWLSLNKTGEPNAIIHHFAAQNRQLENQVRRALDKYSEANVLGKWARSIVGIGPVIAAGLLAHIDMAKAPTVGHIWRYAGLDNTVIWRDAIGTQAIVKELEQRYPERSITELTIVAAKHFGRNNESLIAFMGEELTRGKLIRALTRRPWNASLKTLCWKIGESFVKVKGNDSDVYGKIYEQRKASEHMKNEAGDYAEQARAYAVVRPTHAQKAIYLAGQLPDGHIHARAKRYAVKLFLAHLHEMHYRLVLKETPPLPYPIAYLGHIDRIAAPGGMS